MTSAVKGSICAMEVRILEMIITSNKPLRFGNLEEYGNGTGVLLFVYWLCKKKSRVKNSGDDALNR